MFGAAESVAPPAQAVIPSVERGIFDAQTVSELEPDHRASYPLTSRRSSQIL